LSRDKHGEDGYWGRDWRVLKVSGKGRLEEVLGALGMVLTEVGPDDHYLDLMWEAKEWEGRNRGGVVSHDGDEGECCLTFECGIGLYGE
jgi:hypothetical protein